MIAAVAADHATTHGLAVADEVDEGVLHDEYRVSSIEGRGARGG
jgi:hypothetical protein